MGQWVVQCTACMAHVWWATSALAATCIFPRKPVILSTKPDFFSGWLAELARLRRLIGARPQARVFLTRRIISERHTPDDRGQATADRALCAQAHADAAPRLCGGRVPIRRLFKGCW